MNTAKLEKLCPGCMHELPPEGDVCPKCGWRRDGKNAPHQLPPGTLLGGKYYVGAALREDRNGITYIAYDINAGERLEVTEYYPQATATRHEGGYNVSTMTRDESALAYLNTLPRRRETFLENGTAYAVTPLDLEQEKKRLDAWEAEKKAHAEAEERARQEAGEAERKKREKREKQRKLRVIAGKVLGVLILAGCAAGVFFLARWGIATLRKASFMNVFLSGHEDMVEYFGHEFIMGYYVPLRIPVVCAVLLVLFLLLAAAAVIAVFLLRGRRKKIKIWKRLGIAALFAVAVSCVVIAVGIMGGRVAMPSLIAEGETYTGEQALLSREVTDLGSVQACKAYQYDGQGRMVKEMSWVSTNPKRWTISAYAYNEQGDVIRREFSDDEAPEPDVTEYEYTYDEQGRVLTKTGSDGSSAAYDEQGRVLERTDSSGRSYRYEYNDYDWTDQNYEGYDATGVEIEYDSDGEETLFNGYRYLNGLLVEMSECGGDRNPDRVHKYTYTAGGVLSQEEIYDADERLLARRYCDEGGNVVLEDDYNNSGALYQITRYIYERP